MPLNKYKENFQYIEHIKPETDDTGNILEFMPQSRYKNTKNLPLNPYGQGPFCRFKIKRKITDGGVYFLQQDGIQLYIGICNNLNIRLGLTQYGSISPKNCYKGGQSTNCRINNKIFLLAKKNKFLELWFLPIANEQERKIIESHLIQENPHSWNIQRR